MTYQDLVDECQREGIGTLFWSLLIEVAGRVARPYPPNVYNDGQPWSEEAIRDLALDVALQRLLDEHQLEFVLAKATDNDSLSRLLAFQVRRVLSRRRSTTVVDRLVSRVRQLVSEPEYQLIEVGSDSFISLPDGDREPGELSEAEIHQGSRLIDSIPRLTSYPSAERESKVYTGSDLRELVQVLVTAFNGISIRDLRRILETTLTAWLPTILRGYEEDHVDASTPDFELQRTEMRRMVSAFAADLDSSYRIVLIGKAHGVSDGDLALRLGRSRPWLADRKREVLDMVERRIVSQLPPDLHSEATLRLIDELEELESPDD